MSVPRPDNEAARLRTLRLYGILDTASEHVFDDLTRLAAAVCEVPISLISLVDEGRQWFKSRFGIDATESSRDFAFCAHAILGSDVFVVPDALADERFANNPLVTSEPNIRFYAGAPLEVTDGVSLGTLCVIDRKPRQLRESQLDALRILRSAVMTQLELRRALRDLRLTSRYLPMCSWCRSVKLPDGTWQTADKYLEESSPITHGMCPSCMDQARSGSGQRSS